MHMLQKRILEFAATHDLGNMSLRQIGELLGESHPQKIKHHLFQLEHRGLIEVDRAQGIVRKLDPAANSNIRLVTIPILGSANCGPATIFADDNIHGFIKVSSKLVNRKHALFGIKVVGHSMNKANIGGHAIEDGDYVLVDSDRRSPQNKEYVLSVMDGVANIKRYFRDDANEQIVLFSESTHDIPPILIHPDDLEFLICGTVIRIIKKPVLS